MKGSDFYKHPRLNSLFGKSRLSETAERLTSLNLYPSGKQHVTFKQAWTFIYALCASERASQVEEVAYQLKNINDRSGRNILDELDFLLSYDHELLKVERIIITKNHPAVTISRKDGSFQVFADILAELPEIREEVTLPKSFLIWLKVRLNQNIVTGRLIN